jgi:hypothetical protein
MTATAFPIGSGGPRSALVALLVWGLATAAVAQVRDGAGLFEPKYNDTMQSEIYKDQKQFRPPPPPPETGFRRKSAADPLFDPRFKPYDYDDPSKWKTRERDREQGNVNPGAVDPVPLFRF